MTRLGGDLGGKERPLSPVRTSSQKNRTTTETTDHAKLAPKIGACARGRGQPTTSGLGSRGERPLDRLLDVNEASSLLGLKPRTLYKMAYAGRVPVVKIGRASRFRLSTLERLIAEWERPSTRPLQAMHYYP